MVRPWLGKTATDRKYDKNGRSGPLSKAALYRARSLIAIKNIVSIQTNKFF